MTRHSGARATLVWLVAAAGLTGIVVLELSDEIPLAPTVTAASIDKPTDHSESPDNQIIEELSSDTLDNIVNRPLFSVSRRPFVPLSDNEPNMIQSQPGEMSLELVGTMLTGATHLALLRHSNDGLLRLRLGQEVEGWLIDRIDQDRVRLQKDEEVEWLTMRTDVLKKAVDTPKTLKKTETDGGQGGQKAFRALPLTNKASDQPK